MKTDTELEALLRSTFAGRAETVRQARPWAAPAPAPRRSRRWVPALAAAATVIAVVVGVLVTVRLIRSENPKPQPAVPTICRTTLPAAWNASVTAALITPNGSHLWPLAVAPDRTVLASRGVDTDAGAFSAVIVTPDRKATSVMRLSRGDVMDARSPAMNDRWALFGTRRVSSTNDYGLWVVDLAHGNAVRQILDLSAQGRTGARTLQDWMLLGDTVYYTASDTYTSSRYRLYSYGLRNSERTELAVGRRLTLHSVYGSLSYRSHPASATWGPRVTVLRGNVPSGTPPAATSGEHPVVTDGASIAWTETARHPGRRRLVQTAYWWAPGRAEPSVAWQRSTGGLPTDQPAFTIDAVAGPFLIIDEWDGSAVLVVDTRTHAVAPWRAAARNGKWLAVPAGGGVFPVVYSQAKFGPSTLYLPPLSSMPTLTCH